MKYQSIVVINNKMNLGTLPWIDEPYYQNAYSVIAVVYRLYLCIDPDKSDSANLAPKTNGNLNICAKKWLYTLRVLSEDKASDTRPTNLASLNEGKLNLCAWRIVEYIGGDLREQILGSHQAPELTKWRGDSTKLNVDSWRRSSSWPSS